MTFTLAQAMQSARRKRVRDTAMAAIRRKETMLQRYGRANMGSADSASLRIRMVVSDWYLDEFGNRTRTVRGE